MKLAAVALVAGLAVSGGANATLYDFEGFYVCTADNHTGCSPLRDVWLRFVFVNGISWGTCLDLAKQAYMYPAQLYWHCNPKAGT